jgi:glycine cleavage system transcriptional repressor
VQLVDSWLVVTAVGRDRPGIVSGVTRALLNLGCNLGETSMTRLRNEFAMILLVRLAASVGIDAARSALATVAEGLDLMITLRALKDEEVQAIGTSGVGYILRLYGADRPGIVSAVTELLAREKFNITDLETRLLGGEDAPVYVMVLEVDAPSEERGEAMRDELRELAARLTVEVSYDRLDEEVL